MSKTKVFVRGQINNATRPKRKTLWWFGICAIAGVTIVSGVPPEPPRIKIMTPANRIAIETDSVQISGLVFSKPSDDGQTQISVNQSAWEDLSLFKSVFAKNVTDLRPGLNIIETRFRSASDHVTFIAPRHFHHFEKNVEGWQLDPASAQFQDVGVSAAGPFGTFLATQNINAKPILDVVFVVDFTNSMGQLFPHVAEFTDILTKHLANVCGDLRVGFVAFRKTGKSWSTVSKKHIPVRTLAGLTVVDKVEGKEENFQNLMELVENRFGYDLEDIKKREKALRIVEYPGFFGGGGENNGQDQYLGIHQAFKVIRDANRSDVSAAGPNLPVQKVIVVLTDAKPTKEIPSDELPDGKIVFDTLLKQLENPNLTGTQVFTIGVRKFQTLIGEKTKVEDRKGKNDSIKGDLIRMLQAVEEGKRLAGPTRGKSYRLELGRPEGAIISSMDYHLDAFNLDPFQPIDLDQLNLDPEDFDIDDFTAEVLSARPNLETTTWVAPDDFVVAMKNAKNEFLHLSYINLGKPELVFEKRDNSTLRIALDSPELRSAKNGHWTSVVIPINNDAPWQSDSASEITDFTDVLRSLKIVRIEGKMLGDLDAGIDRMVLTEASQLSPISRQPKP